jgi:predicted TIM-barrel enzyme
MEPTMSHKLMILPASNAKTIRLVSIPDDFESQEAFRQVTGLIAAVEEQDPNCDLDDILATLEDHGFESVEFILGPSLG